MSGLGSPEHARAGPERGSRRQRQRWGVSHTDHAISILEPRHKLKSRPPVQQAQEHRRLHQATQWPAGAAIAWSSRTRVAAARPPPPRRPGLVVRGRVPQRRASAWSGRRSACCQCLPRRCREARARPAGWWAPPCRAPAYKKKTRPRVGRARGGARAGQREVVRRTSIARSPRSSTPGGSSAELKSSSTYTSSSSSSSFSSSPPFSRRAAASTRADSCANAICRQRDQGAQRKFGTGKERVNQRQFCLRFMLECGERWIGEVLVGEGPVQWREVVQ